MEHYLIEVKFYKDDLLFPSSKRYTYKVPKDVHLDVGDDVVVMVNQVQADRKYHTVRVVAVMLDEQDVDFVYKWIIQKVDTVPYLELVDKEKLFKALVHKLMNRKKKQSILDQLSAVATKEELDELKQFM